MWIFNRVVVTLLLAGLFALGVSAVVHSLNAGVYRIADLPTTLRLDLAYQELSRYIGNIESGNLVPLDYVILITVALVGLVLLILELKPRRPRRVRVGGGTYITRSAVESKALEIVEQEPEVLEARVNVKAQRRPGARVDIRGFVRAGDDVKSIQSEVRDLVQRRLSATGIPVGRLKVQINESDPRETKTRVK